MTPRHSDTPRSEEPRHTQKASEDSDIARITAMYPPADITPEEFEEFVAGVFRSIEPAVSSLRVEHREPLRAPDGEYEIDATVRYRWGGLDFVVLVEAKLHANPIKREVVQILHSKIRSTGAHKGVLVSTSPFQSGALRYAKTHGIALVTVTEGRFTFEARAATPIPALNREEAFRRFGLPVFVGHWYEAGETDRATLVTAISLDKPEYIQRLILGARG